jgi:tetratricopeptide (TPR) repeat protein
MKKYGDLPQAKTWITNYPFNAGMEAFKIGNYDFATSLLSTYLKNDKIYQKEANLRLFQAALYTMNWDEAAKACAYLEEEIGYKQLEAYFPEYERWKSCLETQNPEVVILKSNILLIEENQRVYTDAKKGLSSGNNANLKTMEKQALFFDSIGIQKFAKEAWIELGAYYFKKTKYDEAERIYNLCMDKETTDFECHKNYIILLLQQGIINPAHKMADSLFALYPNETNVRKACGQVYNTYATQSTQYGTDAETIELFEKSLSFDENEVTCLFLAYYYKKTGKYAKKDEMVKRAKAVNSNVFNDYPDFKVLLGM